MNLIETIDNLTQDQRNEILVKTQNDMLDIMNKAQSK